MNYPLTLILLGLFIFPKTSMAQIGIGTTEPHISSIVDVKSKNKGFLPPRMNKAQMNSINNPAEGLMVYCTNCCLGGNLSFNDGTEWVNLGGQCIIDRDNDGKADATDIDKDNDGIIDANEIQNIENFRTGFGKIPTPASCYLTVLGAPNYSGIPAQTGSVFAQGNVTDGHYQLVTSASCGAPWASSSVTADATDDGSGNVGYFMFVNAPHGGGEVVYGRTINIPKNSTLEAKLSIVNLSPSNADKPNLQIRFTNFSTGEVLAENQTGDITSGTWDEYTVDLVSTEINLVNLEVVNNCACGANGNDFGIDDVIITVKYSDLDGDGLDDGVDQDSDGDGIPDIIENQLNNYVFPLKLDSDNDGLDNAFEPNGLIKVDTDLDGYPDYLDTDSDNDGILDKDETGIVLTGTDLDNDGMDDAIDISTDFTKPGGIYHNSALKDTDGDGVPDYRDN